MDLSYCEMDISDIPIFTAIRNQCTEYLHDPTQYTVEQATRWFNETKPEYYMLVHDGKRIGYFRTSNRTKDSIYIGLDIAKVYRGKGFAIPAYKMFMQDLYGEGIRKFYLRVLKHNERAIHIYKKLGFIMTETTDTDILMEYDTGLSDYRRIYQSLTYDEKDSFRNHSVLITGCNGFIGVWLCNFFQYLNSTHGFDMKIHAIDIQDSLSPKITDSRQLSYDTVNIIYQEELNEYLETIEVDYIFNCAGVAVPTEYMRMPLATLDVSYIGTSNILDAADRLRVKSVVCFSSSEVYGSPEADAIPTSESHVGRIHTHSNRSCYDVGKLVLETLCYTYHDVHKVPVKVIRPFNLYGPGMDDTRVVPNMIRRVLAGQPIKIYGDGLQTRTFCYMADAMVMILKVALWGRDGEIYNVGNSDPEVNMMQLVAMMREVSEIPIMSEQVPYPNNYPDNEPRRRCPDISKVVALTGYKPEVSLVEGLSNTYQYFKSKQNG